MTAETVAAFSEVCADVGVSVSRATPSTIDAAVESAIEPPAVGADLSGIVEETSVEGLTMDPTRQAVKAARTGVTPAAYGVAESGSLVIVSTSDGTEPLSLYPDRHVAILDATAIVESLETAFERLGPLLREGRDVVLATGPSATADMGDLVIGAHGPDAVHAVIVEEES